MSDSAGPITQRVQSLSFPDSRGKHRILAELKRLEQETRFLEYQKSLEGIDDKLFISQRWLDLILSVITTVFFLWLLRHVTCKEDIELLEKMENASAACKEMLSNVETRPDPLLSETIGPINPSWDRWFEGPQDSKGCRCWFL